MESTPPQEPAPQEHQEPQEPTQEETSPEPMQEVPQATESQPQEQESAEPAHTEWIQTPHKEEKQPSKTPDKTKTPQPAKATRTPVSATSSATKRKFDALHARNLQGERTIQEHETNKKARAAALTGPSAKRQKTTPREFSFARPTASSANRAAAIASAHAKATPAPPARRPVHAKARHTPARPQRVTPSVTPKTPATAGENRHFSYTPYSGPLPPLTVESSFAPKHSQGMERGRTARVRVATSGRKPRPTASKVRNTGKENAPNSSDHGADGAVNSKTRRSPLKTSTTESLTKEKSSDALQEEAQRAVAQGPTLESA